MDDLIERIKNQQQQTNDILHNILKLKNKNEIKVDLLSLILTKIENLIDTIKDVSIKNDYTNEKNNITGNTTYKEEDKIRKLKELFEKISEDIEGKIKVYLKIKPDYVTDIKDKKITVVENIVVDENIVKIKCGKTEKKYGPFKKIFKEEIDNDGVYDEIKKYLIFENIKGKTNVFMNYGISGSGKTYTLFGSESESEKGLFYKILKGYESEGKKIYIDEIFEEYVYFDETLIQNDKTNNSVIIDFNKLKGTIIKHKIDKNEKINDILSKINNNRIESKRISKTPFNNQSSRSHLYIITKIVDDSSNEVAYIVVIDTAGKESPSEILKSYDLNNEYPNLVVGNFFLSYRNQAYNNLLTNYIKKSENDVKIDDLNAKIKKTTIEGIYINESLNQLVKYLMPFNEFKNMTPINIKKSDYIHKVFFDKSDRKYGYYDPNLPFFKTEEGKNHVEIIKIFDELKNKSKSKKLQFFMICGVRKEPKFCKNVEETLEFVNQIKSSPDIETESKDGRQRNKPIKSKIKSKKKSKIKSKKKSRRKNR